MYQVQFIAQLVVIFIPVAHMLRSVVNGKNQFFRKLHLGMLLLAIFNYKLRVHMAVIARRLASSRLKISNRLPCISHLRAEEPSKAYVKLLANAKNMRMAVQSIRRCISWLPVEFSD